MPWFDEEAPATSWSAQAEGATAWTAEAGTTGWSLPEGSVLLDPLFAPFSDGAWIIDWNGDLVGWSDWPTDCLAGFLSSGRDVTGPILTSHDDYPLVTGDGFILTYVEG